MKKIKSINDAMERISSLKDREEIVVKYQSGKCILRSVDGKLYTNYYADMIETNVEDSARRLYSLRRLYNRGL